jgi:hypothetical protein
MKKSEILIACAGALDRFGERHQMLKAIEEMGELQQALAKYMNALVDNDVNAVWSAGRHVEEEIADLEIVMYQLRMIFDENSIARWQANKIDQLKRTTRGWRDPKLKRIVDDLIEPTFEEPPKPAATAREAEEMVCDACEIRME